MFKYIFKILKSKKIECTKSTASLSKFAILTGRKLYQLREIL